MPGPVTELLTKWQAGDPSAQAELISVIYDELRKLGRAHLRRMPEASVLQPTALVHEAWLRLASGRDVPFHCRSEFFALASRVMRDLLVDQVRRRRAGKRGGDQIQVPLLERDEAESPRTLDFLVLDQALLRLSEIKPRCTRIIELRFFSGLTIPEIASTLDVSRVTVEREWTFARLWLNREFSRSVGIENE